MAEPVQPPTAPRAPIDQRVHGFITPALDGAPTGGTLYNAQLIAALQRAGLPCRQHTLTGDASVADLDAGFADVFYVDSLYLEAMPRLRAALPTATLKLLVHYLPSLTILGRALKRGELERVESAALWTADGHIVTSAFMRDQLLALGMPEAGVLCVEPGVTVPPEPPLRAARDEVRGVMLCNLVEPKGVLPLLQALQRRLRPEDQFRLQIAGSLEQAPLYADTCRSLIERDPQLQRRVELLGSLAPPRALALLQDADVLLSASRMESYGMALAEARALGVPILARAGGHSAAHIDAAAGGVLVRDERELAGAWLGLTRDRAALEARTQAARAHRGARSWDQAAADFIAQC